MLLLLQCARQGFALGLALLLDMIPSIRVDAIFKLSVDLLEVSSSMKGQVTMVSILFILFESILAQLSCYQHV